MSKGFNKSSENMKIFVCFYDICAFGLYMAFNIYGHIATMLTSTCSKYPNDGFFTRHNIPSHHLKTDTAPTCHHSFCVKC